MILEFEAFTSNVTFKDIGGYETALEVFNVENLYNLFFKNY